jgi:hypothetical protein
VSTINSDVEANLEISGNTLPTGFCVLGVRVDAVQIPEAVRRIAEWIARREGCR